MVKKNTKHEKQLLIESTEFVAEPKLSKDLKESVKLSNGRSGTLIVRNIPCTILNRKNRNGRIYTTEVIEEAIKNAKPLMAVKQLFCSGAEHPEGSFIPPTTASHVVINAYVKKNVNLVVDGEKGNFDVMFQDWEVLNTQEGKNLRALFEAECSIGTSIRGVGDMNGEYVEDYEFLGTDCVGLPSSSTYTRMPVSESVMVEESANEVSNALNEGFVVTSTSTDVTRDIEQAADLSVKLDQVKYGTVVKTSTKLDSEINPQTGAETSLTTLEAETEDEEKTIDAALNRAKQAFLNGVTSIDSVTIEYVKEEEPKESVEEDASKEELTETRGIISLDLNQDALNKRFFNLTAEAPVEHIVDLLQIIEHKQNKASKEYDPTIASLMISRPEDTVVSIEGSEMAINTLLRSLQQSREFKYSWKESVDLKEFSFVLMYGNNSPYELYWNKGTDSVPNGYYSIGDGRREILTTGNLSYAKARLKKLTNNDYTVTKYMPTRKVKESAEEGKARSFVLKTPRGFVSMDGNSITFIENPDEALHFMEGKEESGLVHLSGVEKILDAMGVYDVNKFFQKGGTAKNEAPVKEEAPTAEEPVQQPIQQAEVPAQPVQQIAPQQANVQAQQPTAQPVQNNTQPQPSDTRYVATVIEPGAENTPDANKQIPISGIKVDAMLSEVNNLWNMKSEKVGNGVQIKVRDNYENKDYNYDPNGNQLVPIQNIAQQESAEGKLEKDDNKLSIEVDDGITIEKEFNTPEQASIVKAGIENDEVPAEVMLDEAKPSYEDIVPGWYLGHDAIGISGPFETEEEAKAGIDPELGIECFYVSQEDIDGIKADSIAAESCMNEADDTDINEKMKTAISDGESKDVIIELLNAGADVNVADEMGVPPLFRVIADEQSTLADIQSILDMGADINHKDNFGNNILHYACATENDADKVKLLIDAGADKESVNNLGMPVLDLAKYNCSQDVIDLLSDSSAIDEKLYNEPSVASDEFVEKPIEEGEVIPFPGNYDIVMTNIDWDKEAILNSTNGDEEALEVINALPNFIGLQYEELVDMPEDISNVDELKNYLIQKANKELGVPLLLDANVSAPSLQ